MHIHIQPTHLSNFKKTMVRNQILLLTRAHEKGCPQQSPHPFSFAELRFPLRECVNAKPLGCGVYYRSIHLITEPSALSRCSWAGMLWVCGDWEGFSCMDMCSVQNWECRLAFGGCDFLLSFCLCFDILWSRRGGGANQHNILVRDVFASCSIQSS